MPRGPGSLHLLSPAGKWRRGPSNGVEVTAPRDLNPLTHGGEGYRVPGRWSVRGRGWGWGRARRSPVRGRRYRRQTDVGDRGQPEVDVVCVAEMQAGCLNRKERESIPTVPRVPCERSPDHSLEIQGAGGPEDPAPWTSHPPGQKPPGADDPAGHVGRVAQGRVSKLVRLLQKGERRAGCGGWARRGTGTGRVPRAPSGWRSPQA